MHVIKTMLFSYITISLMVADFVVTSNETISCNDIVVSFAYLHSRSLLQFLNYINNGQNSHPVLV